MTVLRTGDLFTSMGEARDLVNRSIVDRGESYKVVCSNQERYVLTCRVQGDKTVANSISLLVY